MPQIALWSWELAPDMSRTKTYDAYRAVLKADPCSYCGRYDSKPVVDHIHPRADWGDDVWGNTTAACRACNSAKRSNSLLGFLLGEVVGRHVPGVYVPGALEFEQARRQRWECVDAWMAA